MPIPANVGAFAIVPCNDLPGALPFWARLGFERTGVGRSVGFKHGRWVDIVHMQKALNGGDTLPPSGGGVTLTGH